jgi:hypothetical protein
MCGRYEAGRKQKSLRHSTSLLRWMTGSAKSGDSGATALIEPESGRWVSLMRVSHASRSHSTESSRFWCYCGVAVQATGTVGSLWLQLVNAKLSTRDWLPPVDTLTVAEV